MKSAQNRLPHLVAAFALAIMALPMSAFAKSPSSLIKGSSSTVYYRSADNRRFVFPNASIFSSWYDASSTIQTVNDADLSSLPLGGNVTYRPGAKLVKVTTDPKVYAVSRYGVLRWVTTEQLAASLYGADWNKRVVDVPDAFFINYSIGAPIVSAQDFSVENELDASLVPQADIKSSQPALAISNTSVPQRVQISYYAPYNTTTTVMLVDGTFITDQAIAMCKSDCNITLQVNVPASVTAFTSTSSTTTLQSNTVIISPE